MTAWNERKDIFRDDTDHFYFLELLSQLKVRMVEAPAARPSCCDMISKVTPPRARSPRSSSQAPVNNFLLLAPPVPIVDPVPS